MTQVRPGPSTARPDPRPAPRPTPDPRRAWLVVGLLLLVPLAAAIIAAATRPTPQRVTVHAWVTVYGLGSFERPGDDCAQPLFTGRAVSVFDESGRALGATRLAGHGTAADRWHTFAGGYADACRYPITIPGLDLTAGRYTLAVGTEPGDGVDVDRDQLQDGTVDVPYGHS